MMNVNALTAVCRPLDRLCSIVLQLFAIVATSLPVAAQRRRDYCVGAAPADKILSAIAGSRSVCFAQAERRLDAGCKL
jgi:hypothetical protein